MAIDVRVCAAEDVQGALGAIWHYFGGSPTEEDVERMGSILPTDRVHAAFDGEAIVGGAGAYLFETTVPGGAQVPTAGVVAVGVLPTHRRRGALTKLMQRQLGDAHERGEPIATLYASEGGIYSRFGYGLASLAGNMELPKEHALLWDDEPIGQARILDGDEETLELLPGIYDRIQAETVGMFTRTPDWWKVRRLFQRHGRPGQGEQVRVAIELDGKLEAYALYRLNFAARHMISESTLEISEALGTSPRALAAIWRYLLGIDWVARIDAWWLPLDHPLLLWLREPRRMRLSVVEAVWVRLVDVGSALAARGLGEGSVVLDVRDEFCPWNTARWSVREGNVTRTTAEADVVLGASELGSVYLGGFTFEQLLRAARAEELKPGGIERADELFRTSRQPWCPELF
jgi:predicted acetyltransferase